MALAHAIVAVLVFLYEGQWVAHQGGAWVAVGCVNQSPSHLMFALCVLSSPLSFPSPLATFLSTGVRD